jgi:circadian clock protein KaiC
LWYAAGIPPGSALLLGSPGAIFAAGTAAHRGVQGEMMEFVKTGVPNLDLVLGGGLVAGSLTMLIGPPGSGKTILTQQFACHVARESGRVLVLTTLPEPHVKLLNNLRTFSFFDEQLIGNQIDLINVYRELREDFANASANILRLVREQRATTVVIDSFDSIRALGQNESVIKELLYELSGGLGLLGVTAVIISSLDTANMPQYAELTIADHIIALRNENTNLRGGRWLEVAKMRGAAQREGWHRYTIDSDGMHVYPRLESVVLPAEVTLTAERQSFGLPELDAMMDGGPPHGSTTLITGNPGTGKTLFGLHFLLTGARLGEHGLYFSFHESAQQLLAKCAMQAIPLPANVENSVDFIQLTPIDFIPDEMAATLRERIDRGDIRRVVFDGLTELLIGLFDPVRHGTFLTALSAYFRQAGVTACYIQEQPPPIGVREDDWSPPLAPYCDNIVLLRRLTSDHQPRRTLAVLTMRNSAHDHAVREFQITANGLMIASRE